MENVITELGGEYRINLPVFEGPLDLLLYLIKKNDVPIRDIPVAVITDEYLRYLDTMKELDIDLAGEFVLTASELLHIKSQMLLPVPLSGDEEEDDPRTDLVRRLLEYQRFKDASVALAGLQMLNREVFVPMSPERPPDPGEAPIQGNVYSLIEAFDRVLKKMPKEIYHNVAVDRVSVNQRIMELVEMIKAGRTISLEDLLPTPLARYDVVVSFLALLEMARLKMITVFQAGKNEPLYITGTMREAEWNPPN